MDFKSLRSSSSRSAPTHPIRIFEATPSLRETFNDLWRGQADALEDWHRSRSERDVLVSLNTGAGKTVVGCLIAQSLVNEGHQNVIYLCSTIDLVNQTSKEAEKLGIRHSCRARGTFSNDAFEVGEGFCITTYQALFSGHSALRNRFFPEAIIFDDAHVADSLLRDAFTISISRRDHPALFADLCALYEGSFDNLGISGKFRRSLDPDQNYTTLVSPGAFHERRERLREILLRHRVGEHPELTFPFAWAEDHLHAYSAVFCRGVFELTPPFLPSRALDIFSNRVQRRVYLSATLESQTDFIRAFGRKPDEVITPANDAGNGERLVVNGRFLKEGFGPDFASKVAGKRKTVIAVPSYRSADRWKNLAVPPAPENFSNELDSFRKSDTGAFVLVSRVDGIDLPHDTCRVMIMEGLPGGTTLLERYQWEFLGMSGTHAVRVANRLAQLFGRINRGRNDYGVFFIEGNDLGVWLRNHRNLVLLPPLLRKQILVGRAVQDGLGIYTHEKALELMEKVLERDEDWLSYYQSEVKSAELDKDKLDRHSENEPALVDAALAEAKFAEALWQQDYGRARRAIEQTIDNTTAHDTALGGWHAMWLGATFEYAGDFESALPFYGQAMSRLGNHLVLPRPVRPIAKNDKDFNEFGNALYRILNWTHAAKFETEFERIRSTLSWIDSGSSAQAEEGVRLLGELLGFQSRRPDNDKGTGPDVLWLDEAQPRQLGLELKTDKSSEATYFKDDINQGLGHVEWMKENCPDHTFLGLSFIGPEGPADKKATVTPELTVIETSNVAALRDRLLALMRDLRDLTPMERAAEISRVSEDKSWDIEKVWGSMSPHNFDQSS